jgi:hypothetical protein
MNITPQDNTSVRFARCLATSKRVHWEIHEDVIRGRQFETEHKFLPDGLSRVEAMSFLSKDERRYLSQIQGRTYANMFGLVERFINAKMFEIGQDHCLGDQVALQAIVRFNEEEIKHQALFREIDCLCADVMPEGYCFGPDANDVARAVLGQSTWAVLALTLMIELYTQSHYRESIEDNEDLSPLFKDVFLYHWKEESQHAIIDELEFLRHDAGLNAEQRDQGVDDFTDLVEAMDAILQQQAAEDVYYFASTCGRDLPPEETAALEIGVLAAYRWQYIFSGAQHPHFGKVMGELITPTQCGRIETALKRLAA